MAARPTNSGLAYLRRSGKKQELSLDLQLNWDIQEAQRQGVQLDAATADLGHMRAHGLCSYKAIRLDDAITGADSSRPGYKQLLKDVLADPSKSHVFYYRRDRLSRPTYALEMVQVENDLRHAGITIVLSDKTVQPLARGVQDPAGDIQAYFEYHESGSFLNQLAERIISAHVAIASRGYSTGGRPPYGHLRALYGPGETLVEFLPPGKVVRHEGHHVRWVPGPDEDSQQKIKTWLLILELYHNAWGAKRIAQHLNGLGIPSPGAGSIRTDQGVRHRVSGKWGHRTVLELIENSMIVGSKQYGRRSEGHHRRFGKDNWRLLDESDFLDGGKPKLVHNSPDIVCEAPSGNAPLIDKDHWNSIQLIRQKRGRSQRGISRAKDPTKYPLSTRVIDLSDGCGSLMYGVERGGRRLYGCGIYMRTDGAECNNNCVDSEALLEFVLQLIEKLVRTDLRKDALRQEIRGLAELEANNSLPDPKADFSDSELRLVQLKNDQAVIRQNMARESDSLVYAELRVELQATMASIAEVEKTQSQARGATQFAADVPLEDQVDAALSLLDDIGRLVSDPDARLEIRAMLERLNCRIGLSFVEGTKGKKRKVRRLAGGVVAFGDAQLPVKLHGHDHIEGTERSVANNQIVDNRIAGDELMNHSGRDNRESTCNNEMSDMHVDTRPSPCHQEEVSLTMVSRAERI